MDNNNSIWVHVMYMRENNSIKITIMDKNWEKRIKYYAKWVCELFKNSRHMLFVEFIIIVVWRYNKKKLPKLTEIHWWSTVCAKVDYLHPIRMLHFRAITTFEHRGVFEMEKYKWCVSIKFTPQVIRFACNVFFPYISAYMFCLACLHLVHQSLHTTHLSCEEMITTRWCPLQQTTDSLLLVVACLHTYLRYNSRIWICMIAAALLCTQRLSCNVRDPILKTNMFPFFPSCMWCMAKKKYFLAMRLAFTFYVYQ